MDAGKKDAELNEKVIENPVRGNEEIYRLWYEYLQANKTYGKMCMEQENFLNLPEKERPLSFFNNYLPPQINSFYEVNKYWGDTSISWENKLSEINDRINQAINNHSEKIVELKEPRLCPPLSFKFNDIEIQDHIALVVPLLVPIDDLVKQFKKIITEKQKEVRGQKIKKRPLFPLPSKKLSESDIENLRRYLEVYRLRENRLPWKDVMKEIDPNNEIHSEATDYKVWRRERGNARDIIENVSRNIFPGEYGQVKERKKRTTKKRVK